MEKLLIQSQGSAKDPKFGKQIIKSSNGLEIGLIDYFKQFDIRVLKDDLINSCHGNTELTLNLAKDIQKLSDDGHKVVCLEQGGLYFAKPSLEAANMPTVPVVSIPLNGSFGGIDAFLAASLPSGTAAIGGVGIGNYQVAAKVSKEILVNDFEGVYIFNPNKRLEDKLTELMIPILGQAKDASKDSLIVGSYEHAEDLTEMDSIGKMSIFTPTNKSKEQDANLLRYNCAIVKQSVYTRGEDNVAFFAAKIIAPKNKRVFDKLKSVAEKKANSYDNRNITIYSFTGGK